MTLDAEMKVSSIENPEVFFLWFSKYKPAVGQNIVLHALSVVRDIAILIFCCPVHSTSCFLPPLSLSPNMKLHWIWMNSIWVFAGNIVCDILIGRSCLGDWQPRAFHWLVYTSCIFWHGLYCCDWPSHSAIDPASYRYVFIHSFVFVYFCKGFHCAAGGKTIQGHERAQVWRRKWTSQNLQRHHAA